MLRQMDVAMSCFKIKPLKALAKTNTPPTPVPRHETNVEVQLDHFWPRLNNIDQGGVAGMGLVAIALPNTRNRRYVGKKVQNS